MWTTSHQTSHRSLQIHGPTTGEARLETVESLMGGTIRRLVSAEQRSTAWLVSNAVEWSEVLQRE